MNEADNALVMGPLNELIDQAEREGKWLWCRYQDMWFSPAELRAETTNGRFRWGAVNWRLRDPQEHLDAARQNIARSQGEAQRIADRIASAKRQP